MDKHIRIRLESCRPGSDDLHDPDLQASDLQEAGLSGLAQHLEGDAAARSAFQAMQQWDAKVTAAMEDLPVPEGLTARLLERLRATAPTTSPQSPISNGPITNNPASNNSASEGPNRDTLREVVTAAMGTAAAVSATGPDHEADVEIPPAAPSAWPRRRWLAVLATAGVLMAGIVGSLFPSHGENTLDELVDDWRQGLGDVWLDVRQAPRDAILPAAVLASPVGWQNVRGHRGIAYKLMNAQGQIAYLFVMRLSHADLPQSPPGRPQSTTGGRTLGYWQRGEWVYVLMVDPGEERNYRTFVRSGSAPLA